jgi:hypothetical protein
MGIKTTMTISRADAVREILVHLHTASDDAVSEALEDILGDKARFWNFIVIPGQPGPEHDPVYTPRTFD